MEIQTPPPVEHTSVSTLPKQSQCPFNFGMSVRDVTGEHKITVESVEHTKDENKVVGATLHVRIAKDETGASTLEKPTISESPKPALPPEWQTFLDNNRDDFMKSHVFKAVPHLLAALKEKVEGQLKYYDVYDPKEYSTWQPIMESANYYRMVLRPALKTLLQYSSLKDLLMLDSLDLSSEGHFDVNDARQVTTATLERLNTGIQNMEALLAHFE